MNNAASNHLKHEQSPYLLQHAENPVHWHAWNEEAFARARNEDKPIFLSIGYSTCHWCHVMAHESFEDDDVAKLLNDSFIAIKVDREERPDIDNQYMTACQMLTGQGGWPLTIVMTPDKRPFFAATYIPRESRQGRTGLVELLPRIADVWKNNRIEVNTSAESIADHMQQHYASLLQQTTSQPPLGQNCIDKAVASFKEQYDTTFGGFGNAPKFPSPHNLLLLMRHAHAQNDHLTRKIVEQTLTAMRLGGMYDHIGFGFHRYSTDRQWLLPHFEKMLYDQAMLSWAYVEAWQLTGNPLFRRTAEETFTYVLRDMTDKNGAFYSAEDADSLTDTGEKEEGWFYTYTLEELAALPDDLAQIAIRLATASDAGNFSDEATHQRTGRNIFHISNSPAWWAAELNMSEDEFWLTIGAIRSNLLSLRNERPRPHLDDKILTDWNGLMIAALAKGARAFDAPHYAEAAARAAEAILEHLQTKDGKLQHRLRGGQAGIQALADDYAFFIFGLTALFEATGEAFWLAEAKRLQAILTQDFADTAAGGLFHTAHHAEKLLVRSKEVYDAAIPSANSIALLNLLTLSKLLADVQYAEKAEAHAKTFATQISHHPTGYSMFLCGVHAAISKGRNVIITGAVDAPETEEMLRLVNTLYAPDMTLSYIPVLPAHIPSTSNTLTFSSALGENYARKKNDHAITLPELVPFTASLITDSKKAVAFICEDFTCSSPLKTVEALRKRLHPEQEPKKAD